MIRRVTLKDFKQIAKLYYAEMSKQFKDVGEAPITAKKYEQILAKNQKAQMFVLDTNNIKGFIWFAKNKKEFNLEEIFVTEKGKGYGKQLMDFLLGEAKKHKIQKINLDVHFKNQAAQDFFKKLGFSERTIEMSLDLQCGK